MKTKNPKKEDKRVQYTKMFLREALLSLLAEKPIEKITTTELCQKAEINRNTFYSHYYSPKELLDTIEDELIAKLVDSLGTKLKTDSVNELISDICRLALEKRELCTIVLPSSGSNSFMDKLVPLIKPPIINSWKARGLKMSPSEMDMTFYFLLEGSSSVVRTWLQEEFPVPPETIAALIVRLSNEGITDFI